VIDVLDSLGVPVHATAAGLVEGPPVAVLATCAHRCVSAHSRIRLCGEELTFSGPARLVESWLAEQNERLMSLAGCIARSSSKTAAEVLEDLKASRYLSATEAIGYGLADEILAADARVLPFRSNRDRPSVGFRPPTS
jgi:ATP-dependent Clp protease protease subunit